MTDRERCESRTGAAASEPAAGEATTALSDGDLHVACRCAVPEVAVDLRRIAEAVLATLQEEGAQRAEIEVALVDDETIRRVHRDFLQDDTTTDVISFPYGDDPVEGELVIGALHGQRAAGRSGWPLEAELVWYAIHGTLHLLGYDDRSLEDQAAMRARERAVLDRLGYPGAAMTEAAARPSDRPGP